MNIICNTFVRRQMSNSRFSHFEGDLLDDLPKLVEQHFNRRQPGYRDGVITVTVPPSQFRTALVELHAGDELTGIFESRREGEAPRKHIGVARGWVGGKKMPAKSVIIVLYSSETLAEDDDNNLEPVPGNWEIVSINASPVLGDTPMAPDTLLHNHFGSDGGTATKMSDSELVEALRDSFEFWKDKAMLY